MKSGLIHFLQRFGFPLFLVVAICCLFAPVFLKNQTPFSANLLASFFNPYAIEKFSGWNQGIPNKPVGIDDIRIFYPQRFFTMETLRQFQLPFWNPYSFSGNYHIGLSETAVFYPLNIIFFFMSESNAWIILIMSEPFIAGYGMYLFLHLILKNKKAAMFGGLTFAFSGLVLVRMVEGLSVGHTLMWVSFALYAIEGWLQKKQVRFIALLLFALISSLFAGWFQFAFYTILYSLLYLVYRLSTDKTLWRKDTFLIFVSFLFTPLIGLIHIIPAFEMFQVSPRGMQSIQQIVSLHLMPLEHGFTYLFPDLWGNPGAYNFFGKSEYKESILFIGVTPFIVSLFSFGEKKLRALVTSLWLVTLIAFFLGTDNAFARTVLSLHLPVISSFLPDRIFFFSTISLVLLSGIGMKVLIERKNIIKFTCLVVVISTFFMIIPNLYLRIMQGKISFMFLSLIPWQQLQFPKGVDHLLVFSHNLVIPELLGVLTIVCIIVFRFFRQNVLLFVCLTLLLAGGQIYFGMKYIPFSQKEFVFPNHPVFSYLQQHAGINRFISTNDRYIASNVPLSFNIFSPDGVGSMYISRYGELVQYMQTKGKDFQNIPRIETRIAPMRDEVLEGTNPYLLRFMQLDGVSYVVTSRQSTNTLVNMKDMWDQNSWSIYQYTDTLPRVFWTNTFVVISDKQKILQTLFDKAFDPHTLVLEKDPHIVSNTKGSGIVKVLTYTPEKIMLEVNSSQKGLVYLSDNYSNNFTAFVDGGKGELLRADYTFRAIVVPGGRHVISLEYSDTYEKIAFIFAIFSSMTFIGVLFLISSFRRTRKGV